ncbi:MAG: hypothetical protein R3F16_25430 [Myxococcota bacterium]
MRLLQALAPIEAFACLLRIIRAGLMMIVVAIPLACSDADRRRENDRSATPKAGATAGAPAPEAPTAGETADPGLEAVSTRGRYRIGIRPEIGRASIGVLHAWLVDVSLADGRAADVRDLRFDGGMPQHGHGFETAPRVTGRLGPSTFRVDGVRFSMAGDWTIRIDVAGADGNDSASFVVDVGP